MVHNIKYYIYFVIVTTSCILMGMLMTNCVNVEKDIEKTIEDVITVEEDVVQLEADAKKL